MMSRFTHLTSHPMTNNAALIAKLVSAVASLKRGRVWCRYCGRPKNVNSVNCLTGGWPKCCGYTMTIDSPEEQQAFKAVEAKDG